MRSPERPGLVLFITALAALACGYTGCSDSDSPAEPEGPAGVAVRIAPADMNIGITETHAFSAVVTGGQTNSVEWYAGGVPGGNSTFGTITSGNPATYTAPDAVPTPHMVMIRAVSTDDSTRSDSCRVTITHDRIYVDSNTGDDVTGVGGKNKPFATLTHGLSVAKAGNTVVASPGYYDDDGGETFPISIPDSVVLEGADWENCVIRLDAELLDVRTAVDVRCRDCAFRKFTLEEAEISSHYWTTAVLVSGAHNALADSLRCLERALHAVLRVQHDDSSTVRNCHFVVSDGNRTGRGLEIVFNDDGNDTILRNLTVSGFHTGLQFNAFQNTLVENCNLSGNAEGAHLCCWQDVNSQPNPDFGGGARGGLGGNVFSGNTDAGLVNATANVVYARFNVWDNDPPVEGDDYDNTDAANGGDVITE